MTVLKAPFPWFGGKSRVAPLVWSRFGDVPNYCEPFAGSLAVLLGRETPGRIETVNDIDAYVANFWRALEFAPEEVAKWADGPVNETDLHARHRWLVDGKGASLALRAKVDPDFFSAKVAGWWVWGQCLWIGSGWCQRPEWSGRVNAGAHARGINRVLDQTRPRLTGEQPHLQAKRMHLADSSAKGVHRDSLKARNRNANGTVHQQRRPHMTSDQGALAKGDRRWQGGGQGGGSGVHAPTLSQQKPALNGDAGATGHGIHASRFDVKTGGLYDYMNALALRLRRVRVCCGDWTRVLTPSVTTYMGITGVMLDPPYSHDLREQCYSEDHDISADVREWAIANGENPLFRIALCGYEEEHAKLMPDSWEKVAWKAHGGYSRTARGKKNRGQERIWFSPHCERPTDRLPF